MGGDYVKTMSALSQGGDRVKGGIMYLPPLVYFDIVIREQFSLVASAAATISTGGEGVPWIISLG